MRHRVYGKKLSKDKNARKALFKNLISSLVIHGQIRTTEARAKAIKGLVDRLISRSKQRTLQARRSVLAFLQDKNVVNKLVDEIAPKFGNRPSGFTRILRLGRRAGDQAMMVKMEFVESSELQPVAKPLELKKVAGPVKRRPRRLTPIKTRISAENNK
ncbi:MAG: 50S ribosomal protein L17 [Patescibacteria group bacterium]